MQRRLAPAKVNLSLHVTGQRPDGYHLLDSLVCFADFGDQISLQRAESTSLTVSGPFAQGVPTDASNLILKAVSFFEGAPLVAVHLDKRLPAAAGIGGGSADAAATLRLLAALTRQPVPVNTAHLGADVPVCLFDSAVRMQGVGEVISPLRSFPKLPAVLINPSVAVPTPKVFKALVSKDNPPMGQIPPFEGRADCIDWLAEQRNDLQPPAVSAFPQIAQVLVALDQARLTRMSGSGATCFGLFDTMDAAKNAAHQIAMAHPEWWVQACTLS